MAPTHTRLTLATFLITHSKKRDSLSNSGISRYCTQQELLMIQTSIKLGLGSALEEWKLVSLP